MPLRQCIAVTWAIDQCWTKVAYKTVHSVSVLLRLTGLGFENPTRSQVSGNSGCRYLLEWSSLCCQECEALWWQTVGDGL